MRTVQGSRRVVRVVLYCRVSSDKQANKEDGSLDTQLDRLEQYVRLKSSGDEDWRVVERLVEGEVDGKRHGRSGKNTYREAFQRLMELVRGHLVDVILVTKLDRISRSVRDFTNMSEEFSQHGVQICSLKENFDTGTPVGRFTMHNMISLAQFEREQIQERIIEKTKWRAEKGMPIGCPPAGYKMKDKRFVIDPKYSKHISLIDQKYLEFLSIDKVVKSLKKQGITTKSGRLYNKPMVARILRNPVYAGFIVHRGKKHLGLHKAIRDAHVHELIQKNMDLNKKRRRPRKSERKDYTYLVQSLVHCGKCMHVMVPKVSTGRNGPHPYYVCSEALKSAGCSCTARYLPAQTVDAAILEFVKTLELKPDVLRQFVERANQYASTTLIKLLDEKKELEKQIGVLKARITNLNDVLSAQGMKAPKSTLDKILEFEHQLEVLDNSLKETDQKIDAEGGKAVVYEEQFNTVRFFNTFLQHEKMTAERIKCIIPKFIDYIVWHEGENGEGKIEIALFSQPFATTEEMKELVIDVPKNGVGSVVRSRVKNGGPEGIRTPDLVVANDAFSY